jgi:methylenetetrahydrofolate dehydrogenase (NADP+)/methenyltetrahydrofolate cyclohydrolase/formyltetrahydrofolate synthetase
MTKRTGQPLFIPCTPRGIIELLKYTIKDISGKRAAVLGRSDIVVSPRETCPLLQLVILTKLCRFQGTPVATLLAAEDATVTLCHSKTQNVEEIVCIFPHTNAYAYL